MGITHMQIILDNPTGSYCAGTNVTGRLQFNLDRRLKIQSIEIKFVGKAETSWSESQNETDGDGHSHARSVTYEADEEYFSNKYYLTGGPHGEIEMQPGNYEYPFTTTLPPLLPPSFDSKHGKVTYTIIATLDLPYKSNQKVVKVFTVMSSVDLNFNEKAKKPVKLELEKFFCCCWCKSGPLTVVINIPYSGFLLGQTIPMTLEVDNASKERVDNVIIELVKMLTWKARSPSKKERNDKQKIVTLRLDAVEPNDSKSYSQQLAIPVGLPCSLDPCSIITCTYALEVTAKISGCHFDLSFEVPIFLGTVPLYFAPLASPHGGTHFVPVASPPGGTHFVPSAPPPTDGSQLPVGFMVNPAQMGGNIPPYPGHCPPYTNAAFA